MELDKPTPWGFQKKNSQENKQEGRKTKLESPLFFFLREKRDKFVSKKRNFVVFFFFILHALLDIKGLLKGFVLW